MKKNGFIVLETLIQVLLILVLFGAGITAGTRAVQNFTTYDLKSQCDVLDRTLEMWAKAHQGVEESSITQNEDGKLVYKRQRLYPLNLSELGEVQNMKYFSQNIDIQKFMYSTQDGGTKYKLEVILPDGTVYKSPRSGQ